MSCGPRRRSGPRRSRASPHHCSARTARRGTTRLRCAPPRARCGAWSADRTASRRGCARPVRRSHPMPPRCCRGAPRGRPPPADATTPYPATRHAPIVAPHRGSPMPPANAPAAGRPKSSTGPSGIAPSRTAPSRVGIEQRRAEQDRAEQSRFEQSRAEQHRAAQHTDAEQGRAAPPAPTLPTAGRHRMADGAPERSGGEGARPTDPRPSRAEPSAPRGIGLTTPRSLRHLGRPRDGEIRPALTVTLLPALAAAGHAWLPGAAGSRRPRPDAHGATPLLGGHRGAAAPPLEVRRAAHNPAADRPPAEYRPGHGPAGPGRRARSLAMTDLLASGRPLAIEGAPAPTRMGSAFAPAHEIAVRRSGAAAPAPPAGAGGATPDGDTAPAGAGPLAAARRRAAETAQHRAAATASPRGEEARPHARDRPVRIARDRPARLARGGRTRALAPAPSDRLRRRHRYRCDSARSGTPSGQPHHRRRSPRRRPGPRRAAGAGGRARPRPEP